MENKRKEQHLLMPPEGIALLLNDTFEVKCRFSNMDSIQEIYPEKKDLFAAGQLPSAAELANIGQGLHPQEMAVIVDRLMIVWLMMCNEKTVFLIGPVQVFPPNPTFLSNALQDLLPGKSSLKDFYKYLATLPSAEDNWFRSLVRVFSRAFCGNADPEVKWVELYQGNVHNAPEEMSFNPYAQSAYEIESQYLEAVYLGSSQNAIDALHKIQNRFRKRAFSDPNMLLPGIYGNAVNCTLARIAAYQAGVSPVILDEIFQEQMTLAITGRNVEEQFKQAFRMTAAVCDQVQKVRTTGYAPLVRQCVCYLLEHYQQEIRLESVADSLGVNKNYLSGIFTKETGKSFITYLNDIRLEQAAIRIRLSSQSIGEIAASVGLHDQNYFARLFQKKYHMSPSAWRKNRIQ